VVYHLRDSAILSGHKEGVYADESVVAVVVSSATVGVFYAIRPSAESTIAYRRRNGCAKQNTSSIAGLTGGPQMDDQIIDGDV
jgi:hypothetical protein